MLERQDPQRRESCADLRSQPITGRERAPPGQAGSQLPGDCLAAPMRVLLALSLCRTKSGGPARCPTETIGLPQSLWAAVGMREGFPSVATALVRSPLWPPPSRRRGGGSGAVSPAACQVGPFEARPYHLQSELRSSDCLGPDRPRGSRPLQKDDPVPTCALPSGCGVKKLDRCSDRVVCRQADQQFRLGRCSCP